MKINHSNGPRVSTEAMNYCKTRKKYDDKIHENALKQFSRRLKFTNLASEPQKNLTYLFMFPECIFTYMNSLSELLTVEQFITKGLIIGYTSKQGHKEHADIN